MKDHTFVLQSLCVHFHEKRTFFSRSSEVKQAHRDRLKFRFCQLWFYPCLLAAIKSVARRNLCASAVRLHTLAHRTPGFTHDRLEADPAACVSVCNENVFELLQVEKFWSVDAGISVSVPEHRTLGLGELGGLGVG